MNDKTPTAPKTFKERVIKEGLTHAGKKRAVDEEIEVTESQREFLRKREFIANPEAAKAPKAKE